MSRRHLIHAALALTLSAGLAATSDAARAQGRREGHDRNRDGDHQRDGQSAGHRDHQSRQSQSSGGGRWDDHRRGERSESGSRQSRQYDSRQGNRQRSYDSNTSYGGHGGHGYDSHSYGGHGSQGHYGYDRHGYGGHGHSTYGYNGYGYNAYGYGVGYVPTYRYLYGGAYYSTNDYGATLLRNSVNYGYQQGLALAYQARASNWGYDYYRTCDAYRVASYGYQPGYIDPLQYSYYYRVGFERGYREGFYAAPPVYAGAYRPGPVDLVVGVLDVILNLQHVGHHGHH